MIHMKKYLIPFLVMTFVFALADDASAQRRGKKKRRTKEKTEERSDDRKNRRGEVEDEKTFLQNLNNEIKVGNVNFFNNQFSLSLKGNSGYKINKWFSAGLGGKLYYDFINGPGSGNNFHFTSYGGLAYARAKVTSQFYVQAEYNITSFEFIQGGLQARETFTYPTAGIGYMYEGFDWTTGVELLVPIDETVMDLNGIVEYWISFSHNF